MKIIWEIYKHYLRGDQKKKKKKDPNCECFLRLQLSLSTALLFMAAMISVRTASFAQTRGLLGNGHH